MLSPSNAAINSEARSFQFRELFGIDENPDAPCQPCDHRLTLIDALHRGSPPRSTAAISAPPAPPRRSRLPVARPPAPARDIPGRKRAGLLQPADERLRARPQVVLRCYAVPRIKPATGRQPGYPAMAPPSSLSTGLPSSSRSPSTAISGIRPPAIRYSANAHPARLRAAIRSRPEHPTRARPDTVAGSSQRRSGPPHIVGSVAP